MTNGPKCFIICSKWNTFGGDHIETCYKNIFLFRGLEDSDAAELVKGLENSRRDYPRGAVIYSPDEYRKEVGFILSGECDVYCHGKEEDGVILNTLLPGDSFGILAVLNDEDKFPTVIYAKKNTSVLFIGRECLMKLIETSPVVAMNVILFLSKRLAFLNGKLDTVTKGRVDTRLASFLINESNAVGGCCFDFNIKKCSEKINAGRTSVYRALDFLKNMGYIEAENRKIIIKDKQKLEEFTK